MKNLDDILKKTAQRYGLEYNPNQKGHKVQNDDGTLEDLAYDDFESIFDLNSSTGWLNIPDEMVESKNEQLIYDKKIHQKVEYNFNHEPLDNTQDYSFVSLEAA